MLRIAGFVFLAVFFQLASAQLEQLATASLYPDSSQFISGSTWGNHQLWMTQNSLYVVQMDPTDIYIDNMYAYPAGYVPLVATVNTAAADQFTFFFIPASQTNTLILAQVDPTGGFQILKTLTLPYSSNWEFMVGDDPNSSPVTLFLASVDYVVAVDAENFVVGSAVKLVDSKVLVTTVSALTIAIDTLYIARSSTPDKPGQIIAIYVPVHKDVTGDQVVMYLEEGPNAFFATNQLNMIYWTQSVPGHSGHPAYGLLWQYDNYHHTYQNITIPFHSPTEHFGAARSFSDASSVFLVSGPFDRTALGGFWAHTVSLVPYVSWDGSLKQPGLVMPTIAAEMDIMGPGTTIVGTRNSTADLLAMYSFSAGFEAQHPVRHQLAPHEQEEQTVLKELLQSSTVGDPPTCSVSSCGPGIPCSASNTDCYEFERQIWCCVVSPYPSAE